LEHSFGGLTPAIVLSRRWIYTILEQRIINDPTDADGWIPWGLLWDCQDENSLNPSGVMEPATMDNIRNFSTSAFFQSIILSPAAVNNVRDFLKQNQLPSGENASDVDAIFLEYQW